MALIEMVTAKAPMVAAPASTHHETKAGHHATKQGFYNSNAFTVIAVVFQVAMIILYGTCTMLDPSLSGQNVPGLGGSGTVDSNLYTSWIGISAMLILGFGFLYTLMRRYAWGGVSVNYLILAFAIQWGLLCNGFWDQLQLRLKGGTDGLSAIPLTLVNFTRGNFVAAAVLISFGAVIGRVSPLQMVVLVFWQCICSTCNEFIGGHRLHVSDPGGSMFIHIFGASTGLALAWMIGDRPAKDGKTPSTTRHNGTFAMIGTLFLFLFWPSFNAGVLQGAAQARGIFNTILSILASVTATFAFSRAINGRFTDYDVQNATLAGGVAMGAACDMLLNPWGALLTGFVAGTVSTYGFNFASPWVRKRLGITDTCGILNLHFMPGVIGGVASAIAAAGIKVGPDALSWSEAAIMAEFPGRAAGHSALQQGGYQMAVVVITAVIGAFCGITGGWLIRLPVFEPKAANWYEDAGDFNAPDEEEEYPELLDTVRAMIAEAAAAGTLKHPAAAATGVAAGTGAVLRKSGSENDHSQDPITPLPASTSAAAANTVVAAPAEATGTTVVPASGEAAVLADVSIRM